MAPLVVVVRRGGDMNPPGDSVSVINDENNTLYSNRREEDPPGLLRGDMRPKGVPMGLDKLGDLVVGGDCRADEVPRGVCTCGGVGEREAGEDAHEANDGHIVGEGKEGDAGGR